MKNNNNVFIMIILVTLFVNHNRLVAQVTGSYIPAYQQTQSNWCWATCTQMLYWAYKPGSTSQCNIVDRSKILENSSWWQCGNFPSTGSPCTNPSQFNSGQYLFGCGGSVSEILNYYGISSSGYNYAMSTYTLANDLSNKRPYIAQWNWNSGGAHAVLIYRYKNGNVYFNNPGYGSSYIWSYSAFMHANGQGTWTKTLAMNNSTNYGAVLYKSAPTSIKNLSEPIQLEMNLFPNPCISKVNVIINGAMEQNDQLIITDAVGKIVSTTEITKDIMPLAIDVSKWDRGIYFVRTNKSHLTKQLNIQ